MDLSTIGIYRCRHHFNVCVINSTINTENIPPSSCGGFVQAYVPIRPIMVRSERASSMGATESGCVRFFKCERYAFRRNKGESLVPRSSKYICGICNANSCTLTCMLYFHSSLIQLVLQMLMCVGELSIEVSEVVIYPRFVC